MVTSLKAKDLMTNYFKKAEADLSLNEGVKLLDETDRVLFIFNGDKFLGSITEWDIIKSGLNKSEAKLKTLAKPCPKINKDLDAPNIARLMLENDLYELPVFDDKKLIGVVSVDNLLKKAVEKEFGKIRAKEVMSPDVVVINPKDNLLDVINLFKQNHISRAPVVENEELIGVLRMHDIIIKVLELKLNPEPSLLNTHQVLKNILVDSLISFTFETAATNTDLKTIVEKIFSNDLIEEVIIVDENKCLGMITKKDLLELVMNEESKVDLIKIQVSAKTNVDKEVVVKELKEFAERFESVLGNGYLHAYFVRVNNSLIEGRIRLYTDKLKRYIKKTGRNELEVVNKIIDNLKLSLK